MSNSTDKPNNKTAIEAVRNNGTPNQSITNQQRKIKADLSHLKLLSCIPIASNPSHDVVKCVYGASVYASSLKHIVGVGLGLLLGWDRGGWCLFVLFAGTEVTGGRSLPVLHEGFDEEGIGSSDDDVSLC